MNMLIDILVASMHNKILCYVVYIILKGLEKMFCFETVLFWDLTSIYSDNHLHISRMYISMHQE